MEDVDRERLAAMSAEFYRFHGDSFDDSRQRSWDSWGSIAQEIRKVAPKQILDLGCGNGRFAAHLQDVGISTAYRGIDSESSFVATARRRYPDVLFEVGDINDVLADPQPYDLIVSFGVFHHIPGKDARRLLMKRISERLTDGGMAVISFWQPRYLTNFDNKVCTPDAGLALEPNDFLLSWKGDCSRPRFCHHFDNEEITELVLASTLTLSAEFQGEGNDSTNRYVILRRSSLSETTEPD